MFGQIYPSQEQSYADRLTEPPRRFSLSGWRIFHAREAYGHAQNPASCNEWSAGQRLMVEYGQSAMFPSSTFSEEEPPAV